LTDSDVEQGRSSHVQRGSCLPGRLVTLQLNWLPEAEHGGYYAAQVHGDFAAMGLDVEILPGGPGSRVIPQVATGRVTFGVTNADRVLLGLSQRARTVALLAPMQTSPRCILVHEKSGIRKFEDLKDLTLAMSTTSTWSMFLRKRVPLDGIRIVKYSGNVAQFLRDENLAQQGYVISEPFVARKRGGDPYVLMLSDLGFNPYTSVLITSPDLVDQSPDLVGRMVAACRRGWQRYLDSPDETNAEINRLNPDMDLDILEYGTRTLRPLCIDEATPSISLLGLMTAKRWQVLTRQLVEAGVFDDGVVEPDSAFSNRFLKSLDADGASGTQAWRGTTADPRFQKRGFPFEWKSQ